MLLHGPAGALLEEVGLALGRCDSRFTPLRGSVDEPVELVAGARAQFSHQLGQGGAILPERSRRPAAAHLQRVAGLDALLTLRGPVAVADQALLQLGRDGGRSNLEASHIVLSSSVVGSLVRRG